MRCCCYIVHRMDIIFYCCAWLIVTLSDLFAMIFGNSAHPALALLAQDRLLKHFLRSSQFEVKQTQKNGLNYVTIWNSRHLRPKKSPKTLVLMHGFGLGLGFFYDNYDTLAQNFDRVIAVDWPGMGCSTRNTVQMKKLDWMCSLPAKLHSKKNPASNYAMFLARQVTDEFIDSLEDLRQEEQLTEFVLAGHSLGGFLAAKYALKYPTHLSGLVLISPVGVPFPPPREEHITTSQLDWRIRVLKNLWELNFTPQAIVRVAGSRGPELVKNAIDRRFAKQWEKEELQLLSDYLYQITVLPAQGEYSLNTLLEPVFVRSTNPQARRSYRSGVYAKEPLEQDLCKLGKIPLLLVYGDDDWLYYSTVAETIQLWKKNNVDAELMMVSRAGHHLYTDNAREFNAGVLDWVKRKALL